MIRNKLCRRLALLLSVLMLITSTVNTSFAYIVTQTESLIGIFVPAESDNNSVTISVTVEHELGDEHMLPTGLAFDFVVELGSAYANTTVETSAGVITTDAEGKFAVQIAPGAPLKIENLAAGTKVTATQQIGTLKTGFSVKDNEVTKEATASALGGEIAFVNVYTAAEVKPTNVTLFGEKILSSALTWEDGYTFTYKLEKKVDGVWIVLGEQTITINKNDPNSNEFDLTQFIQNLTFDEAGVYEFRLSEMLGTLGDEYYDESINTFTITVTDKDMDGQLEIDKVEAGQNATVTQDANGNYIISVVFDSSKTPMYPDPDDIEVEIAVKKTVNNTGTSIIGPEGFEFVLTKTDTAEEYTASSDSDGEATFVLTFDAEGTYTYTLQEVDTDVSGVTYDSTVYDVAVEITKDTANNTLVAAVTLNGDVVANNLAVFNNNCHVDLPTPTPITVDIDAKKTVNNTGNVSIGPEGFELVLESALGEKHLATTDASGDASFALTFTAEGTYAYTLYETNKGAENVTYDTNVYNVTVFVSRKLDNTLSAVVAMSLNGSAVTDAVARFENTYHKMVPDDLDVPIEIEVEMEGNNSSAISLGGFTFCLEDAASNKVTTVSDTDGKADFALTFTADDIGKTYTYKLSQGKGNQVGVTYDDTVYTITVTITEDAVNNTLVATVKVNGTTVDGVAKVKFVNGYQTAPPTPSWPDPPSDPTQPDEPDVESSDTGDDSRFTFWLTMMIVSAITSTALIVVDRRCVKKERAER